MLSGTQLSGDLSGMLEIRFYSVMCSVHSFGWPWYCLCGNSTGDGFGFTQSFRTLLQTVYRVPLTPSLCYWN